MDNELLEKKIKGDLRRRTLVLVSGTGCLVIGWILCILSFMGYGFSAGEVIKSSVGENILKLDIQTSFPGLILIAEGILCYAIALLFSVTDKFEITVDSDGKVMKKKWNYKGDTRIASEEFFDELKEEIANDK